MPRYIFITLLALLSIFGDLSGQNYFSNNYDINNDNESGWFISRSGDKIAVLVGALCNQNTTACVQLLRLDTAGNLIWGLVLDTMDVVYRNNLITTDTAIYFAGPRTGDGRFGIRVMQFDWDANPVREANLTDSFPHSSINHLSLVDTNMVLSFNKRGNGEPLGTTPDTTYYYFMDQELDYVRHHKISSGNYLFEVGMGYHAAKDGSGYYSDRFGSHSTWLGTDYLDILKFDEQGELLWSYAEPEEGIHGGYPDLVPTSDGGVVVLWHIDVFDPAEDIFPEPSILYKLSPQGEREWEYLFTSYLPKYATTIFEAEDGDIMGAGMSDVALSLYDDEGLVTYAGWAFRMSPSGELRWERSIVDERYFASIRAQRLGHGTTMPDGGFIFTGPIRDTFPGGGNNTNTWVVRTDSLGCIHPGCGPVDVVTGTEEFVYVEEGISFHLYPNPARQWVRVAVGRGVALPARLEVFDALGRPVLEKTIIDVSSDIDIGTLPGGAYWLRLTDAAGRMATRQLLKH